MFPLGSNVADVGRPTSPIAPPFATPQRAMAEDRPSQGDLTKGAHTEGKNGGGESGEESNGSRTGKLLLAMRALSAAKLVRTDPQPSMVVPFVYLGSLCNCWGDCLGCIEPPPTIPASAPASPADYRRSLPELIAPCCDFISDAVSSSEPVLVHCFAGKSRSATVVLAYLVLRHGMSLVQAAELLKSCRPVVQPNIGFQMSLVHWYKQSHDMPGEEVSRFLSVFRPLGTSAKTGGQKE
eukprot:gene10459-1898_t